MADSTIPGQSQVSDAMGSGTSAVNNFNPQDIANNRINSSNQLLSSQTGGGPSNANDYMKAYASQVASNPSVQSLYNQGNQMFNVPSLQTQATSLQNAVNQETPNVYAMGRGFDMSNEQAQNKINNDLMFLQPEANAATANANTASNLASNFVQAGLAQNNYNLMPIQNYGQMLTQSMAAQATGWNAANQNLYDGLVQKMNNGVALSQTEMQQMAQLAQAKEQYDAAIAGQQAGVQEAKIGAQTLIPPGDIYYNPYANNGTGTTYNPFNAG